MATAAKTEIAINVTEHQVGHFQQAILRHNALIESGLFEGGTILAEPDVTKKKTQVYRHEGHKADIDTLLRIIEVDLKKEVEEHGMTYPRAAENLATRLRDVKPKTQNAPRGIKAPKSTKLPDPILTEPVKVEKEEVKATETPVVTEPALSNEAEQRDKEVEETLEDLGGLDDLEGLEDYDFGDDFDDESEASQTPQQATQTTNKPELVAQAQETPKAAEKPAVVDTKASKGKVKPSSKIDCYELGLNPIDNAPGGKIDLSKMASDEAWETAMNVVHFPMVSRPLFFQNDSEEWLEAQGETNTGRHSQVYGMVVDKERDGNVECIATMTGMYGMIEPIVAYEDLREELGKIEQAEGIVGKLKSVFVSPTGGVQILTIELDGIEDGSKSKDQLKMTIQLVTSINGTKKHHLRLVPYNLSTGSEMLGVAGNVQNFNLSTRHTQAIGEQHVAFQMTIMKMIESWNKEIGPMMELMCDNEFDRDFALDLLDGIMEDAKIPKQHRDNAKLFYTSDSMATNENTHTPYRVVAGMSQYLDQAMERYPERMDRFRDQLNKRVVTRIKRAMKQLRGTK